MTDKQAQLYSRLDAVGGRAFLLQQDLIVKQVGRLKITFRELDEETFERYVAEFERRVL